MEELIREGGQAVLGQNNKKKRKRIKTSKGDAVFMTIVYIIMVLSAFLALYPVYFVLIASVSSANAVSTGQVWFYPVAFNLEGYKAVLQNEDIVSGYLWTILISVGGTFLNLFMTIPTAYILSRKDFMARNVVLWVFLIPMYFGGGLIPTYIWMDTIGFNQNILIMFVPWLVNSYNLIVSRTYFSSSLPSELFDAAKIDGCNNVRYFTQIALPLSKPIVAVIGLYYFVGRWNDWFTPLVYLSGTDVIPLPLVLRNLLILSDSISGSGGASSGAEVEAALLVKYAVIVVSTLPIMCIYPFVQKYFVQGVMLGSVKG